MALAWINPQWTRAKINRSHGRSSNSSISPIHSSSCSGMAVALATIGTVGNRNACSPSLRVKSEQDFRTTEMGTVIVEEISAADRAAPALVVFAAAALVVFAAVVMVDTTNHQTRVDTNTKGVIMVQAGLATYPV